MKINRVEVIYELAKYCHPSWYHQILHWETKWLYKLLQFYKEQEAMPKEEKNIVRFIIVRMGIDTAIPEEI